MLFRSKTKKNSKAKKENLEYATNSKKAFEEKARLEFEKAGTKIIDDKTGEGKL
mgnify:CR=1 FL=1